MALLNNRGSTLLEHVVALFIFSILVVLVCTSFLAGANMTFTASTAYNNRGNVYNQLERGTDTLTGDDVVTTPGSITFSSPYVDAIQGTYYHGEGDFQVSEFISD